MRGLWSLGCHLTGGIFKSARTQENFGENTMRNGGGYFFHFFSMKSNLRFDSSSTPTNKRLIMWVRQPQGWVEQSPEDIDSNAVVCFPAVWTCTTGDCVFRLPVYEDTKSVSEFGWGDTDLPSMEAFAVVLKGSTLDYLSLPKAVTHSLESMSTFLFLTFTPQLTFYTTLQHWQMARKCAPSIMKLLIPLFLLLQGRMLHPTV